VFKNPFFKAGILIVLPTSISSYLLITELTSLFNLTPPKYQSSANKYVSLDMSCNW